MTDWVEVTYPVEMGGYYEDGFWADSNTVQQVVLAASNHATVIENARIIKLLEAEREKHIPWCGNVQPCPECYKTMGLETAIALIKGENK